MRRILRRFFSIISFIVKYTDEISLVIIGLFIYIAAGSTQTGWLYFITALVIGVLLTGYVYPRWNLKGIRAWRECPGHCYEGEEITIKLHMINDSRYNRALLYVRECLNPEYLESVEGTIFPIPHLKKQDTLTIAYPLKCKKRGVVDFPDIFVETSYPFGFFRASKRIPARDRLVIYPVSFTPKKLPQERSAIQIFGYERSMILKGNSFDFLAVREYQPSDGTRCIHWPLTARLNKLMVKEFKDLNRQSIFVLIDMGKDSLRGAGRESTIEYEVKMATGILNYSLMNKSALTLISARGEGIIKQNNSMKLLALEYLASITNESELSTSEILKGYLKKIPRSSALYILQTVPAIDFLVLRELRMKNVNITLFLFLGYTFEEVEGERDFEKYNEFVSSLRNVDSNIQIVEVRKGDDLEEKLGERREILT